VLVWGRLEVAPPPEKVRAALGFIYSNRYSTGSWDVRRIWSRDLGRGDRGGSGVYFWEGLDHRNRRGAISGGRRAVVRQGRL